MYFAIGLINSILLCCRAMSSGSSFLSERTFLDEDKILMKFFAENRFYLESESLWHVTILGATDDQIQQTKSMIKTLSIFVGTDATEICASKGFASNTLIVYFLTSLEEEYVTKVVGSLLNCKKSQISFVFEGIAVDKADLELLLRPVFEKIVERAIFIHHRMKSLKLYSYIKSARDCSRGVELLIDWVPGVNMKSFFDWIGPFNYHGCPLSMGAMNHPPWMYLSEDANGRLRIAGGVEGNIILTIAQKANLTPSLRNLKPSEEDQSRKIEGMVSSYASENLGRNTILDIAQIRPTESVVKVFSISHSYAEENIVWCVPRITRWRSDIMTSEFSWMTWVLIGLTFLASFAVEKFVRNTNYLNKGNDNKSGCCSIILDLIGSTLGNPIVHRPLSIGGKALLIIYICYSLVMTTAYKTSLSSILTVENSESSIVDVRGIIMSNLTTGGDAFRLAILKDQIGEYKLLPELIKRYVIETNTSKALRRISNEKNFAYLTSLTDLVYHKSLFAEAGETVLFDVLNGNVLTHSTVIVVPKSSQWTRQINNVIKWLSAGGLLEYWIRNNSKQHLWDSEMARYSQMVNTEEKLHRFTRDKFYHIFYIYCLALTLCALVFLGELLVHEFKLAGRVERFANLIRFKARRCAPL